MKRTLWATTAILGLAFTSAAMAAGMANEGNKAHSHNNVQQNGYVYAFEYVSPGVLMAPHWNYYENNGLSYYDLGRGYYAYPADEAFAMEYSYFVKDNRHWVVAQAAPDMYVSRYAEIVWLPKNPMDSVLRALHDSPMEANEFGPQTSAN